MSSTLEMTAPADHVVLFYEQDRFLSECVAGYVRQGLAEGRDTLVIATAPHRQAIDALVDRPPQRADSDARFTTLDARATLDDLCINGVVDAGRLWERFTPWLRAANRSGRAPRIYGEVVALLWGEGQLEPALRLEALWNQLAESFSFSLLCGYPMRGFDDPDSTVSFPDVCHQHTAVTTESYAQLRNEHDPPVPMVRLLGGSPGGRLEPE